MNLSKLVAAVNGARAREDYNLRDFSFYSPNFDPSPLLTFTFKGQTFQTRLPYKVRVTEGSVFEVLNNFCYLIEGINAKRVTFILNSENEVVWIE